MTNPNPRLAPPLPKGRSGNPTGRPRGSGAKQIVDEVTGAVTDIRKLCQPYVVECITRIMKIVRDDKASDSVVLAAACYVTDRVHGKPNIAITLDNSGGFDESVANALVLLDRAVEAQEKHDAEPKRLN